MSSYSKYNERVTYWFSSKKGVHIIIADMKVVFPFSRNIAVCLMSKNEVYCIY